MDLIQLNLSNTILKLVLYSISVKFKIVDDALFKRVWDTRP